MLKQSDVLALLGLPIDDERVIAFFNARDLPQPKPAPPTRPDSPVDGGPRSTSVKDPEWGFSYWFHCHLYNDAFPVIKQGRHFRTYFSQIIFDDARGKASPVLPAGFWNVGPERGADLVEYARVFGPLNPAFNHTRIVRLSEHAELRARYGSEVGRITSYYAGIAEGHPLMDVSALDEHRVSNLQLMLIKWLYERRLLAVSAEVDMPSLPCGRAAVLSFVQTRLNGHLWTNQLVEGDKPKSFLFASLGWENDYRQVFHAAREHMSPTQRDEWEAAVPLDASVYAAFEQALDGAYEAYEVKPRSGLITYASAIEA